MLNRKWKSSTVHFIMLALVVIFVNTVFAEERILISEQKVKSDSLVQKLNNLEQNLQKIKKEIDRLRQQNEQSAQLSTNQIANKDSLWESMVASRDGGIYLPGEDQLATRMGSQPLQHDENAKLIPILNDKALQMSGFLDAVYTSHSEKGAQNTAAFNQIELDLAHEVNDRTAIGLSICYKDVFILGAATIAYRLYQKDETTPLQAFSLANWNMTAGQFDIPFGLDYQVYTSISRKTITMPTVVSKTHGGWNDLGILNSMGFGLGTVDAFAVKGFSSQYWTSNEPFDESASDDDPRWAECESNVSGGVRASFTMIPGIEYGASVARGWLSGGGRAMSMAGVHAQTTWQPFKLKGEAIICNKAESLHKEVTRGLYAEVFKPLGRFFAIGRFGLCGRGIYRPKQILQLGHRTHDPRKARIPYRIPD